MPSMSALDILFILSNIALIIPALVFGAGACFGFTASAALSTDAIDSGSDTAPSGSLPFAIPFALGISASSRVSSTISSLTTSS